MGGPTGGARDDEGEASLFVDINITPLTDIFLVLLIIFMVTSTALVEQGNAGAGAGVKVELPKGQAHEVEARAKDVAVAITVEGKIFLGGKEIDDVALKSALEAVAKEAPDTLVIVQADTATSHGKVVAMIEAAKAAGLSRIAIATQ